jgi:hypothetical protein
LNRQIISSKYLLKKFVIRYLIPRNEEIDHNEQRSQQVFDAHLQERWTASHKECIKSDDKTGGESSEMSCVICVDTFCNEQIDTDEDAKVYQKRGH